MSTKDSELLPLIESLWHGEFKTEDGRTLGNCMLGINKYNERFATVPHPVVKSNFQMMRQQYNEILTRANAGDDIVCHILMMKKEDLIGRHEFDALSIACF